MAAAAHGFAPGASTHGVWARHFDDHEQHRQVTDDATAWRNVVRVLLAVVITGVALMVITVFCVLKFMI